MVKKEVKKKNKAAVQPQVRQTWHNNMAELPHLALSLSMISGEMEVGRAELIAGGYSVAEASGGIDFLLSRMPGLQRKLKGKKDEGRVR